MPQAYQLEKNGNRQHDVRRELRLLEGCCSLIAIFWQVRTPCRGSASSEKGIVGAEVMQRVDMVPLKRAARSMCSGAPLPRAWT